MGLGHPLLVPPPGGGVGQEQQDWQELEVLSRVSRMGRVAPSMLKACPCVQYLTHIHMQETCFLFHLASCHV